MSRIRTENETQIRYITTQSYRRAAKKTLAKTCMSSLLEAASYNWALPQLINSIETKVMMTKELTTIQSAGVVSMAQTSNTIISSNDGKTNKLKNLR